jgi:guanylate kinase
MGNTTGKMVIFSAPSGAGKSTLVQYLIPRFPQLSFSISATSRPPRGEEKEGREYYFLTSSDFLQRAKSNQFLEWEEVYKDTYYGTLASEIERLWDEGKTVIFDIDVEGSINLKKRFKERALAVFIQVPSVEVLAQRLRNRKTDNEVKIAERLAKSTLEMERAVEFDTIIINDDLKTAQLQAEEILSEFLSKP